MPNFRAALDAAIAVCLHAEHQCRGASDRGCSPLLTSMRIVKGISGVALFAILILGVVGCEYFRPGPSPIAPAKTEHYDGPTIATPMGSPWPPG